MTNEDVFNMLKTELATRSDNNYIVSGKGGNPTEFLFLLTTKVNLFSSEKEDSFFVKKSENEIDFHVGTNLRFKQIRTELTNFIAKEFPTFTLVTEVQLQDKEFLQSATLNKTASLNNLIDCIDEAQYVKSNLPSKDLNMKYLNNSSLDFCTRVFAIRTVIGIQDTVRYDLDELFNLDANLTNVPRTL